LPVTIVPTVAGDLAAVTHERLPGRIKALTVKRDGRVLGLGGLRFCADGTIFAFVTMTEEGKRYPVALHKAGHRCMREAREAGYRRIFAHAERENPAAERWLERLGFRRVTSEDERHLFVWEC
jgi:RimJ/RimL family protein N-acetyltransferase